LTNLTINQGEESGEEECLSDYDLVIFPVLNQCPNLVKFIFKGPLHVADTSSQALLDIMNSQSAIQNNKLLKSLKLQLPSITKPIMSYSLSYIPARLDHCSLNMNTEDLPIDEWLWNIDEGDDD
jgi:hypothetical protein